MLTSGFWRAVLGEHCLECDFPAHSLYINPMLFPCFLFLICVVSNSLEFFSAFWSCLLLLIFSILLESLQKLFKHWNSRLSVSGESFNLSTVTLHLTMRFYTSFTPMQAHCSEDNWHGASLSYSFFYFHPKWLTPIHYFQIILRCVIRILVFSFGKRFPSLSPSVVFSTRHIFLFLHVCLRSRACVHLFSRI